MSEQNNTHGQASEATPTTQNGALSDLLTSFAEKALSIPIQDLQSQLLTEDGAIADNAFSILETKYAERLASIKEEAKKAAFNEGRTNGKAEAERKKQAEIDALKEQLTKAFDPNEWEKHPLTLEMQQKKQAEIERLIAEKEAEKMQILQNLKKGEILSEVEKSAFIGFDSFNPALPTKDAARVANLKKLFVENLTRQYDFDQVNGQILVLDKNGQVVKDRFDNAISFQNLVASEMSKYYEPIAQTAKGSTGNAPQPTNSAGAIPTTAAEFSKMWNSINDPIERSKFAEQYGHLLR